MPGEKAKTILHATDLLPEGGIAFEHSVALARRLGARLVTVHAAKGGEETRPMPDAKALLRRWHEDEDVPELEHETIEHICCDDPVDTLLDVMGKVEHDLVVVGTKQRRGVDRLVHGSVSESVILNSSKPVVAVPIGQKGFVRGWSGETRIERVVIPARSSAELNSVYEALVGLFEDSDEIELDIHVVAVVEEGDEKSIEKPSKAGWKWHTLYRQGSVVEALTRAVEEVDADLLAMSTDGQDSLLDALVGTRAIQAMRLSQIPVLIVPSG